MRKCDSARQRKFVARLQTFVFHRTGREATPETVALPFMTAQASTVTSRAECAWHARMIPLDLSPALSPSSTSMVTCPARSLVLHWPQIPDRHSNGISSPASSAASRIVNPAGRSATFPDRRKCTVGTVSYTHLRAHETDSYL